MLYHIVEYFLCFRYGMRPYEDANTIWSSKHLLPSLLPLMFNNNIFQVYSNCPYGQPYLVTQNHGFHSDLEVCDSFSPFTSWLSPTDYVLEICDTSLIFLACSAIQEKDHELGSRCLALVWLFLLFCDLSLDIYIFWFFFSLSPVW